MNPQLKKASVLFLEIARCNHSVSEQMCQHSVFYYSGLNIPRVLCLRAECKVHDSASEERCDAAADDQCGQGSADLGPGNSSSGG